MNNTQQQRHNGQAKALPEAQRRLQLIVDLKQAQGRLDRSQERLKELETSQPTAFFEIRRAKDVVSAARAIVDLYALEVKKLEEAQLKP